MDFKEAKTTVENFEKALNRLKWDASSYQSEKKRSEKLTIENKELKTKLSEAKHYEKLYKKLEAVSNVKICPQCGGDGGIEYQVSEFEMDYDECNMCETKGVIDK
jgi:predicted RNase H-like nuclease (RuvC/YqgF family)